MINSLFGKGDGVYFYHFGHQNSCTFEELQKVSPVKAVELTKDVEIPFADGKLNIICGSFYLISELAERFGINIFWLFAEF